MEAKAALPCLIVAVLVGGTVAAAPQQMPILLSLASLSVVILHGQAAGFTPRAFAPIIARSGAQSNAPSMAAAPAIALAVFVFAALSGVWSIVPEESLARAGKLALLAGFALVLLRVPLSRRITDTLGLGTVWGLIGLAGAIVATALVDPARLAEGHDALYAAINLLKQPTTLLVLFFWPAVLWSVRVGRHRLAGTLAGGAALAVIAGGSLAAILAAAVSLAAAGAAFRWPKATAVIIAIAVPIAILALPAAIASDTVTCVSLEKASAVSKSAEHRILIWHFTADHVLERPLLGWGLDSARALPMGAATIENGWAGYPSCAPDLIVSLNPAVGQNLPLHPHNAFLQAAVELGLPAAVALGGTIALLAIGAARPERPAAAAGLGTLTAWLVIANMSYGAWQTWWLSGTILAAFMLRCALASVDEEPG